ncbi:MAG: hypothetical protein RMK20_07350, partial [Verrucomicrobiales bacterium]|nr:hypothetical protein [Verrucomicrobiales bacterium]
GQALDIGGLNFTVIRIMAAVGLLRVLVKGERIAGGWQPMDALMAAWAVWMVLSGLFHKEVERTLIFRMGYVFDHAVIYFLLRVFMRNLGELLQLCKVVILVLAPLALLMLWEKTRGYNWFSVLGGVPSEVLVRNGQFRAQGPFAHPILAGTVGAACLPLAIFFWRRNRPLAVLGAAAAGAIVFASSSSGPILTALTILCGLALWWVRTWMRWIRWAGVAMLVALSLVMQAPVYYLLARIDLTGSSTGWHRAALIESSIKHLGEWWAVGTDYTRHWMPTGVHWSANHTDITNHYLQMGVLGGLPLMLLFMGVIAAGFVAVGRALRRNRTAPVHERFLIWTLGAILFGHAMTFLSVSYFDQTVVYLYFALAAIGSLRAMKATRPATAAVASAPASGSVTVQAAPSPVQP